MDKSLLESFVTELNQIKEYINHIEKVNYIAKSGKSTDLDDFQNHFKVFEKEKKTFEYKAIIISLYGLVEKFIELWIKEYLNSISIIVAYNKLPDIIQSKHFELSLKLITIVLDGREKYSDLKKDVILHNLSNCLVSPEDYRLNSEAFIIQSGNLTHKRIEEIFKNIDIKLSKSLIKDKKLNDIIGIDPERIERTEADVLYVKLNEIVARRNIIAHGALIDNILGLSEFEQYISFLEKYCTAVFNILESEVLRILTVEKFQNIDLINVFRKKPEIPIIAFAIENYEINLGDQIIIEISDGSFYLKEVKSMQLDNVDVEKLIIKERLKIAVGIDNPEILPINQNCKFYLKKI